MSVEATALSRSKLEQKDRSELAAIVEAMGGKAGSRAKKAELVDLVLELAGASKPSAPPAVTSGSPPAENGHANGDPTHVVAAATKPTTEADPMPEPMAQAPSTDEEPPAEWEVALADDHAAQAQRAGAQGEQPSDDGPHQDA